MILLYYTGGARDFEIVGEGVSATEWARLHSAAVRLLEARVQPVAARRLSSLPFKPGTGTNHFNDDFSLLLAVVPIEKYTELEVLAKNPETQTIFRLVAEALETVGYPVRFIAVAPDTTGTPSLVSSAAPTVTTDSVERALRDAEVLLHQVGAASAVDRVHTAMHAYLRAVVDRAGLTVAEDAGMTELWKTMRERHPAFASLGSRHEEIGRIAKAIGVILDSTNTLRNHASGAHPTAVLGEAEASLVVNAVRTLLHYVDARIHQLDSTRS